MATISISGTNKLAERIVAEAEAEAQKTIEESGAAAPGGRSLHILAIGVEEPGHVVVAGARPVVIDAVEEARDEHQRQQEQDRQREQQLRGPAENAGKGRHEPGYLGKDRTAFHHDSVWNPGFIVA